MPGKSNALWGSSSDGTYWSDSSDDPMSSIDFNSTAEDDPILEYPFYSGRSVNLRRPWGNLSTRQHHIDMVRPNPYTVVEPWGGDGGCFWEFIPEKGNISQIVIAHGEAIRSLTFKCDDGEVSQLFGCCKPEKGNDVVTIRAGAHLAGISGTVAVSETFKVVTSLRFYTNQNEEYGPFGTEYGTKFSFVQDDFIVGFHGHCGGLLDKIGLYLLPKTSA